MKALSWVSCFPLELIWKPGSRDQFARSRRTTQGVWLRGQRPVSDPGGGDGSLSQGLQGHAGQPLRQPLEKGQETLRPGRKGAIPPGPLARRPPESYSNNFQFDLAAQCVR